MGEQSLWNLPLGETLVAALSQVLDSGGVPNVLWGNYLLTVYGIPSLTNDASFAVPDDMVLQAQNILRNTGLDICLEPKCVVVTVRSRPPPISHFHLSTKDVHIYLYPQSQVLPNISDLKKAEGQIISASDPSLPSSQIGYGKGAFASEFNCVRVPSATCFTEACLINFVRQARKKDYQCPQDLHYMGWVTYMIEYVYNRDYLDLNSLQPVFQEFLLVFVDNKGVDMFDDARKKLIASGI